MSPKQIVNVLSVLNGFAGKLMHALCLAILGALAIMWSDNRSFPTVYAAVPVVNDLTLKVCLMEKDVGSTREQLNRIEEYAQKQSIVIDKIHLDLMKLKFSHERSFR